MQKATHQGKVRIGDKTLECAVLENDSRVISLSAVFRAFGRTKRGRAKHDPRVLNMPSFVDAKNLQPFINKDLQTVLKPIEYMSTTGREVTGFNAEILPLLCDLYLEAREQGALTKRQLPLAAVSEMLVRSFAKIGIIALIDEATGFDLVRDRLALQKILDKYLTDEWAKWTKTFPDEYYKQLFKLKKIPYPPTTRNKPQYVGHWTNDIVYSRLAPGVLKELRNKNPRTLKGHRKRKFFQHLTRDWGYPELRDHLANVIFLMKGCTTWNDFKRRLNRAAPKYGDTMPIDFPGDY